MKQEPSYQFFIRFYLFIFREGKGGKKRERNINVWLPLERPLLGTWPTTQTCALTGNPTSDPLVCRPALNPLSHISQGSYQFFKMYFLLYFFHYHLFIISNFCVWVAVPVSDAVAATGHNFLGARDERGMSETEAACMPKLGPGESPTSRSDSYCSQAPRLIHSGPLEGSVSADWLPDQVHKTLALKPGAELVNSY